MSSPFFRYNTYSLLNMCHRRITRLLRSKGMSQNPKVSGRPEIEVLLTEKEDVKAKHILGLMIKVLRGAGDGSYGFLEVQLNNGRFLGKEGVARMDYMWYLGHHVYFRSPQPKTT